MPTINFNCPKCNGEFVVDDSLAGRLAECSQCKTKVRIPQKVDSNSEPIVVLPTMNSNKVSKKQISNSTHLRTQNIGYELARIWYTKMNNFHKIIFTLISVSIIGGIIAIAVEGDGINGEYVYQKNEIGVDVYAIIKINSGKCYYALVGGGFKSGAFGTYTFNKQNKTIYFRWSEPLSIAPQYATVISKNGKTALSLETGVIYTKK